MESKRNTGRTGEDRACEFLKKNGYAIIERNFRNKFGEIDIVAREKGVVCFVEVRTRKGFEKHSEAFESVDWRKQKRLSRLAVSFLKNKDWWGQRARFDVVSVSLGEGPGLDTDSVVLLKDAFPVSERFSQV